MTRKTLPSLLGLLAWVAVCFIAAALGGQGSVGAAHFYNQLTQPAWAPPPWLFAPVWSLLYLLMGIAAWRVWSLKGLGPASEGGARGALGLFLVQLAANALWSWLFFAWRMGAASSVWILILWAMILVTLVTFSRHSRLAAWLLVPYLAWVTFAALLAWTVWRLNPVLLGL